MLFMNNRMITPAARRRLLRIFKDKNVFAAWVSEKMSGRRNSTRYWNMALDNYDFWVDGRRQVQKEMVLLLEESTRGRVKRWQIRPDKYKVPHAS